MTLAFKMARDQKWERQYPKQLPRQNEVREIEGEKTRKLKREISVNNNNYAQYRIEPNTNKNQQKSLTNKK